MLLNTCLNPYKTNPKRQAQTITGAPKNMRTIRTKVFKFEELSETAKQKAIIDHVNFEIEVMDENSPYYEVAMKMETPWFLTEALYFDYRNSIIETIKANEYEFYKDGELINLSK